MSLERKRRSSSIVEMALANAGIARKVLQCRRRLSYDLNTSAACSTNSNTNTKQKTIEPASISIDSSKDLSIPILAITLCTTDHTETTASIISVVHEVNNITLTAEPDIEEPILIDHQVKNTKPKSTTSDHNVPSTSSVVSNPIKSKVGKRKSKKTIEYIDYMSDQEDFSTFYGDIDVDSDNWSEGQGGITSEDDLLSAEKKVKRNKRYTKNGSKDKKSDANTEDDVVGESATRIKKKQFKERTVKK